jgi:oligoendopeptidase F
MSSITLPQWNNSDEYLGFSAPEFKSDFQLIESNISKINSFTQEYLKNLSETAQPVAESFLLALHQVVGLQTETKTVFFNLSTFTSCEQSLDAQNKDAEKMDSQLSALNSKLEIALNPWNLFITKTTEENFKKIVSSEKSKDYSFYYSHQRKLNQTLLSNAEENVLTKMKSTGHTAWGNLYDAISGTARVEILKNGTLQKVSIAEAASLTKVNDSETRKNAWQGLQKTWTDHKQSAAQILNALAGWRHDVNQLRSEKQKVDFLDQPLHGNRISKATLEAMMAAIAEFKPQIQLGAKTMAKHLGKAKLDPWDLLAPAPIKGGALSFTESFQQVKNSFSAMDPVMGEFVQMMLDKSWIDASIRPNKRNGAFCTGFAKSGHPRVFQTFMGSPHDTSTLAHELGHAYHSWVMRDMNLIASDYPMTLAETASIFAENVLFDYQIANAKTKEDLLDVYWSIAEGAVGLLINIPTRFEFEKNFYEKRKEGFVSADELSTLTNSAFMNWYGDSLSEGDPMFWATKLHFSIADVSFYNFPYAFGYLFSLSLYARKNDWGQDFSQKYVALLRDTGIMTAEDLIQKHLGEDITKIEFWRKSLEVISHKIQDFSKLETLS